MFIFYVCGVVVRELKCFFLVFMCGDVIRIGDSE